MKFVYLDDLIKYIINSEDLLSNEGKKIKEKEEIARDLRLKDAVVSVLYRANVARSYELVKSFSYAANNYYRLFFEIYGLVEMDLSIAVLKKSTECYEKSSDDLKLIPEFKVRGFINTAHTHIKLADFLRESGRNDEARESICSAFKLFKRLDIDPLDYEYIRIILKKFDGLDINLLLCQ